MKRNNLSFRGTTKIANVLMVDANVTYVQNNALNPANVGNNGTLRNFVYGGTRNYDTKYWMGHYIDATNGGVNNSDPSGLTYVWYRLFQNNMSQVENNFRGSLDLKADLTSHFRWQGTASVDYIGINWDNKVRGMDAKFANPYYYTSTKNTTVERYNSNLTYTNDLTPDFSLMAQVGGEIDKGIGKNLYAYMNGYILPDVYRLSNSSGQPYVTEYAPSQYQTSSAFGQATLGYKQYLYLNLYGRNDWNSTLVYNDGHGHYSYFYPGADVSWIFTDALKLPTTKFDYGKLRASIASVGGGTGNYVANTGAYTANTPYKNSMGGTVVNYSYSSNTLPNQALLPTRSVKFETGLELKMFKNRLGADITWYTQNSKAQIISFSAPIESGVNATLINGGKVRNRGWEIRLSGTPVKTKNFSWDTYFNYTRNRNKVLALPYNLDYVSLGGGDGFQVIAKKGGDYGTIIANYGYALYNSPDGKHAENNGKRVITTSGAKSSSYYVRAQNYADGISKNPVVGNITPDFLGNWRNNFNYKNFQFGFVLDSKFGGKVYSFTHDLGSWLGSMKSTLPSRNAKLGGLKYTDASGVAQENGLIIDGVYKDGTVITGLDGNSHDISGMTMKQVYANGWINPTSSFSYYRNTHSWGNGIREASMFTSSWVSLQQVSLTYDMPAKVASKFKMNGLRFSLVGNNLMYLYNSAKDHINPDNLNSSGSDAFQEISAMPYIRNIGFQIWGSF
jgi:iron complex outermembrane receptor protein